MNMFISDGDRLLASFAATGLIVAGWAALLVLTLGVSSAALWFFFTGQLVGLGAYAGSLALLPEVRTDD